MSEIGIIFASLVIATVVAVAATYHPVAAGAIAAIVVDTSLHLRR